MTTKGSKSLDVTTVLVEEAAVQNVILETGSDRQVIMNKSVNAFRAVPTL